MARADGTCCSLCGCDIIYGWCYCTAVDITGGHDPIASGWEDEAHAEEMRRREKLRRKRGFRKGGDGTQSHSLLAES